MPEQWGTIRAPLTGDGLVAAGAQGAPLAVVVGLAVRLALVLEEGAVLEGLLTVLGTRQGRELSERFYGLQRPGNVQKVGRQRGLRINSCHATSRE